MFKHPAEGAIEDDRETFDFESDDITEIKTHFSNTRNYENKVRSVLNAHDDLYEKHLDLKYRYDEQSEEIRELKIQVGILSTYQ